MGLNKSQATDRMMASREPADSERMISGDPDLARLAATTLGFGKHAGKTLAEIAAEPFGLAELYSYWMQGKKSEAPPATRRAIRDFLVLRARWSPSSTP